ncbi:MAG TPA: GldG family protein [Gammaproteobacteria bacterium]|nr:GldG family protein [Gammaproteobacteria bacterium]
MKLNSRARLQLRIQSGVFLLLFVGLLALLAWLSQRYPVTIDMSSNQRNSLSQETVRLLEQIETPIDVTLFIAPANERRPTLEKLFKRYRQLQPNIRVQTLNPDLHPDLVRAHDIRYDGEVLLEYLGRNEKISQISEANVSNSIQRLLRQGERWLVFLQGHGERNPYGEANHDYSMFATQLAGKGYTIENLTLAQISSIPDNTDVLVLASPRVALLPGETRLLQDYIDAGGNFLWFADPEQAVDGLELLGESLATGFVPGVIVDPNSQLMGLDRIDFALIGEYPRHPITSNLGSLSIFPQAQGIEFYGDANWQRQNFLQSDERSWNETGELQADAVKGDNDDEISGPLTIGMSLARNANDSNGQPLEQRVIIVGDADFLANSYLGNGSNLEIGINLVNWLSHDDRLISISPRPAPDTRLELSPTEQLVIAIFFLLALPLGLLISGLRIWLQRRKR